MVKLKVLHDRQDGDIAATLVESRPAGNVAPAPRLGVSVDQLTPEA
jgi:hypothetical protein